MFRDRLAQPSRVGPPPVRVVLARRDAQRGHVVRARRAVRLARRQLALRITYTVYTI